MPITPTPEEHQDPTLEHESPQGGPAQEKPETTQFVRPARREAQPNPAYRNAVLQAQEAHEQARGALSPESAAILHRAGAASLDKAHDVRQMNAAMGKVATTAARDRMRTEQQYLDRSAMPTDFRTPEI